ncbi:hypothetical protein ACHAXT_002856 [Thalassiosira profunda]
MVRARRPASRRDSFEDAGIVFRDPAEEELDPSGHDDSGASPAKPLSIEQAYDAGALDDDISVDDDSDYSRRTFLRRRHPAYTPRLFVTHPHLAVLPVILVEFLALALTRAVLPSLLLKRYGSQTYIVMGAAECVRGILAFFACPLFGKLSDVWGRRPCLLITVMGTLAPVCSLAFWKVEGIESAMHEEPIAKKSVLEELEGDALLDGVDAGDASEGSWFPTFGAGHASFAPMDVLPSIHRIDVFVVLLALSGMFSSTFTLTFAYISDVVKDRDGRVAAYGLALATFGLSFTIGPLLGGYLANVDDEGKGQGGRNWMEMLHLNGSEDEETENSHSNAGQENSRTNSDVHPLGQHRVFFTSLILAILDLFYIHFLLPESLNSKREELENAPSLIDVSVDGQDASESVDGDTPSSTAVAATSGTSNVPLPAGVGVSRRASSSWWSPFDSVRYLTTDPLLSTIGRVTFLYYTALHAVVSTLVLYAARQFNLGPQRLGELMAALGLSTMVSEAVLVRIAIPVLGETRCMRIGLISFALQCVLLAVADSPWHLFLCAFLAMAGNLVYPSVSSLVSSTVRPEMVGRALGAVNGVKSLTEGVGPLLFGSLLTMSEKGRFPGWPYFLAAIMVGFAYQAGRTLPEDGESYTAEYTRPRHKGVHFEETNSLLEEREDEDR